MPRPCLARAPFYLITFDFKFHGAFYRCSLFHIGAREKSYDPILAIISLAAYSMKITADLTRGCIDREAKDCVPRRYGDVRVLRLQMAVCCRRRQ